MRISDWSPDVCSSDLQSIRAEIVLICRESGAPPATAIAPMNQSYILFEAYSPVVELRQYTLHPGQRDVLIELFEREFIESQEATGIRVIVRVQISGSFRAARIPLRHRHIRLRLEASRVGKECVSTCISRRVPHHYKQKGLISTNQL